MSNSQKALIQNMQTDADLIQRSRNGDAHAFARLVKRYEEVVKKTTFTMCGRSTGQDIAQDVFIRFYRNLKQFKGESKLSTYLTRIAINLSLNQIEKEKRQRNNELQYRESGTVQLTESPKADQFENNEIVEKALQMLEPEFRSIAVLRLIDGYTVDETAKILELPRGTVASRLNRAQKKLKEIMISMNVKNL